MEKKHVKCCEACKNFNLPGISCSDFDCPCHHEKEECEACKYGCLFAGERCPCSCHSEKETGTKFSDFFHNATPEEKEKVMLDVAKSAAEDQKRQLDSLIEDTPDSSWEDRWIQWCQKGAPPGFVLQGADVVADFFRPIIAQERKKAYEEGYREARTVDTYTQEELHQIETSSYNLGIADTEKKIQAARKEAKREGAEKVASWIRSYARRISTNDTTGNKPLPEFLLGEALIDQALEAALTEDV